MNVLLLNLGKSCRKMALFGCDFDFFVAFLFPKMRFFLQNILCSLKKRCCQKKLAETKRFSVSIVFIGRTSTRRYKWNRIVCRAKSLRRRAPRRCRTKNSLPSSWGAELKNVTFSNFRVIFRSIYPRRPKSRLSNPFAASAGWGVRRRPRFLPALSRALSVAFRLARSH